MTVEKITGVFYVYELRDDKRGKRGVICFSLRAATRYLKHSFVEDIKSLVLAAT